MTMSRSSGTACHWSNGATCYIPGKEEMTNYAQKHPIGVISVMYVYPALHTMSLVSVARAPSLVTLLEDQPRPRSALRVGFQSLWQCGGIPLWMSLYPSHVVWGLH